MMQVADLQVIKDIPGFKVILKAILKSQIQQMVEQLAEYTGEESVLLTASVSDGSLSHLGSESGKVFLDDHDDIKAQFLGFCLKRYHKQRQLEMGGELPVDSRGVLRPGAVSPRKFGPGSKLRPTKPQTAGSPAQDNTQSSPLTKFTNLKAPKGNIKPIRPEPYPVIRPQGASEKIPNPNHVSALNPTQESRTDNSVKMSETFQSDGTSIKAESEVNNETVSDTKVAKLSDTTNISSSQLQPQYSTPVKPTQSSTITYSESSSSSVANTGEPMEERFSESFSSQGPAFEQETSNMSKSSVETDNAFGVDPKVDIKVEGNSESEMEFGMTGMESGQMAPTGESWMPNIGEGIAFHPSAFGITTTSQGEMTLTQGQAGQATNLSYKSSPSSMDADGHDKWSKEHSRRVGVPRLLPESATQVMKAWLFRNIMNPYPSEEEKRKMTSQTNLNLVQINNWFTNARRRIIQPMLDASNPEEAIGRLAKYTSHHTSGPWTILRPQADKCEMFKRTPLASKPSARTSNSYPESLDHSDYI